MINKLFVNFVKWNIPCQFILIIFAVLLDSFSIAIFVLLIYIFDVILTFNNKKLPIEFCYELGWHLSPINRKYVGINSIGYCPRCNKEVMLDSQGNWF